MIPFFGKIVFLIKIHKRQWPPTRLSIPRWNVFLQNKWWTIFYICITRMVKLNFDTRNWRSECEISNGKNGEEDFHCILAVRYYLVHFCFQIFCHDVTWYKSRWIWARWVLQELLRGWFQKSMECRTKK